MKNKLKSCHTDHSTGFTLLEVTLVVLAIGLLIVLLIPAFMKHRLHTENIKFIDQQKILLDVLNSFTVTEGVYPPETAIATEPENLSEYMSYNIPWSKETPIGGYWDWDNDNNSADAAYGVYAGLVINGPNRTTLQMKEIDAKIDDGNIASGRFRRHKNGYIYIVSE
ncbi:MAG: hypothetical protein KAI74_07890 [Kiritimatiellae bacterium]|nr:hypothetical protein [Kiritimatiellia bacterium]